MIKSVVKLKLIKEGLTFFEAYKLVKDQKEHFYMTRNDNALIKKYGNKRYLRLNSNCNFVSGFIYNNNHLQDSFLIFTETDVEAKDWEVWEYD